MRLVHVGVREGFSQGHVTRRYVILMQSRRNDIHSLQSSHKHRNDAVNLKSHPAEVSPVQEVT